MFSERQENQQQLDLIAINSASGVKENSITADETRRGFTASLYDDADFDSTCRSDEVQIEDAEDWLYIKQFFKNSLAEQVQAEDTEDWLYIKQFFKNSFG